MNAQEISDRIEELRRLVSLKKAEDFTYRLERRHAEYARRAGNKAARWAAEESIRSLAGI